MDWRVDAGKRRIRERTVHGNEKDLSACTRGFGVALRADLWFHDAASYNSELYGMDFFTVLSYYTTRELLRRDGAITRLEEFSFSARKFFIISLVRRRRKMLERCNRIPRRNTFVMASLGSFLSSMDTFARSFST